MATKMTPNQLREQADDEESRRYQRIGEKIVESMKNDFQGFNIEAFKDEARQIWAEGKVKRKPKAKAPKPIQSAAA